MSSTYHCRSLGLMNASSVHLEIDNFDAIDKIVKNFHLFFASKIFSRTMIQKCAAPPRSLRVCSHLWVSFFFPGWTRMSDKFLLIVTVLEILNLAQNRPNMLITNFPCKKVSNFHFLAESWAHLVSSCSNADAP